MSMSLEKFLSTSYLVPMGDPIDPDCIWGLPCMLHGSPGVGKSSRVRQSARSVGLACEVIELGGRQPEDASGAPFLTKDDKLVIACLLGAVNRLNELGQGVLFFDELTCARPATQGAFLSAMQERRVGDTQFSPEIRVVGAGNPPKEAAGGYDLQPPMANRMAHRDVPPPTIDEFSSYILQGSNRPVKPISATKRVILESWYDKWPGVQGLLVGFVRRFAKHLFHIPANGHADRGKAFPTPRSLEYAARAVATSRCLGMPMDEQSEMVEACIGTGAAADWLTWTTEADLPDPLEMLTKDTWKPDGRRLDRTHAALASAIAYSLGRQKKEEKLEFMPAAWGLLLKCTEARLSDVALASAITLCRAGFGRTSAKGVADKVLMSLGEENMHEFVVDP